MNTLTQLEARLADQRAALLAHPIYESVNSLPRLRRFLSEHVFAVWDFMSLVKRLQQFTSGTSVPWFPPVDPAAARFVLEIVLGEECDLDPRGGYISHFQLYRQGMTELNVPQTAIEQWLAIAQREADVVAAVSQASCLPSTQQFLENTLRVARDGQPEEVAAAFCFGREDLIPEMFTRLLPALESQGELVDRFKYYLQRHIEIDGEDHGPAARRLLTLFCENETVRWERAEQAAVTALEARCRLWDGILSEVQQLP